ncbi:MAG: hypothetical protein ACYC3Q_15485 [Gemmatimonadaceae bacterium]
MSTRRAQATRARALDTCDMSEKSDPFASFSVPVITALTASTSSRTIDFQVARSPRST